jgi:hypothetical protein
MCYWRCSYSLFLAIKASVVHRGRWIALWIRWFSRPWPAEVISPSEYLICCARSWPTKVLMALIDMLCQASQSVIIGPNYSWAVMRPRVSPFDSQVDQI